MTIDALKIYQTHLDVSTECVFDGRAEDYAKHAQLPYVFRTGEGIEVIEIIDDLHQDIGQIHAWLKSQRVSDFHRIARSARFLDEDTIEGFHVTYALRGATPVVDPYTSRMILRRLGDLWRTCYGEHELADAIYEKRNAQARPGLFSDDWTRGPQAVTRDQGQALDTYKAVVDAMSAAQVAGDFDAWFSHFTLPYSVHYEATDHVVTSSEDAVTAFTSLSQALASAGADGMYRQPSYAAFIADDRLLGYHETFLTCDGIPCPGPIRSRMILVLKDGHWRCTSVSNAITQTHFATGCYTSSDLLPTLRQIQQRTKT